MNLLRIFIVGTALSVIGAFSAHATVIDVFAQANSSTGGIGAATGLNIAIGDHLVMMTDVGDCWSAGGGSRVSNADGLIGNGGTCQPTADFGLFGPFPFGALVGKVGAGDYFLVGTAFDQIMTEAGALALYYWDSDFANNSGFVSVNISLTQPIPEPAALGLLGLGLGLLLFRRRL